MSLRASAASGAAVLLSLTLAGCATVHDTLDLFAHSVLTGTPMSTYDQVDRDDPFAGSPAEDYGEGFDVPEAEPVGPYGREQVAQAYATTQDLLEAVYLDQDAVFDEDNSEFTSLLSGRVLEWYLEDLGNESLEENSRHLPFNLSPGTAEPIGDVVKVDGWMRAEAARDDQGWDYLSVVTEYTIVHPLARPGKPVSMRLVTSHFGEVAFYDLGDGTMEAWPSWSRASAPVHCLEEFTFTPAFPDEFPQGKRPRGPLQDAYDLETARDMDECEAVKET